MTISHKAQLKSQTEVKISAQTLNQSKFGPKVYSYNRNLSMASAQLCCGLLSAERIVDT